MADLTDSGRTESGLAPPRQIFLVSDSWLGLLNFATGRYRKHSASDPLRQHMADSDPFSCLLGICVSTPCEHSSFSTNCDFTQDVRDRINNPERHSKIWSLYGRRLTRSIAKEFASEFARCQRIQDNWSQIEEDLHDNKDVYFARRGLPGRRSVVFCPACQEAMNEALKKKIEMIYETFADDFAT